MKYLLPFVVVLAVAGTVPARAELRIYGPYLDDQINQAKQAALDARKLKKDQQDQADQSSLYAEHLSKEQHAQAQASAVYQKELAKEQKDQAQKSADYAAELAKDQKAQADAAATYAKELAAKDTEWRNQRYKLRASQEIEMQALGGKMFDESRLGAEPAMPVSAAAAPEAPATGTVKSNPADVNAIDDTKPNLMKELQEIDKGQ